jgi:ATP-dependent DNA helicase RecG
MPATPATPDAFASGLGRGDGHTLDSKLGIVLGERSAAALRKSFGLVTVADLLSHYPRRYARRGELTALNELPLDENVTIVAEVLSVTERSMKARRGSIVEAKISDGTGILTLTFFNQAWRAKQLLAGMRGMFTGKISLYKGALQLAHPNYELFTDQTELEGGEAALRWATMPIPIYPASSTVETWKIQDCVAVALDDLAPVDDPVPSGVRDAQRLMPLQRALELVHRPQSDGDWRSARDTLRFHEAFVLQAALLQQRQRARTVAAVPRVPVAGGYLERFDARLPFTLTGDQRAVGDEISRDIASETPMNRLVQGEVGSGKTLVALRAMLAVADSGGQSALLAPTEVLAAQHLRSIASALGPDLSAAIMPTLLTGQLPAADRRKALLRTVSGQAAIVVGTHALLGDTVSFYDLGLVVVDEQHRFGVDQREALRLKGTTPPHVVVLTATPIPRTVAMTVFGDLDISTIAELPAGRQTIQSFVVPLAEHPTWERRIWERAAEEIAAGRQVFVVCPAISAKTLEEGESADPDAAETEAARPVASVEATFKAVSADPALASARAAALHGRMSSDEKDAIMRSFAGGEIDLLVATTVIEVGVDVPNASAMIVLDADRFGVSQLHQLRGRVGRGEHPGLCLFVTAAEVDSLARERVDAVAATLDGFELAQVDLELRREGNVLGSNQSGGRSSLRLLRVAHDGDLIAEAREHAIRVIEGDPTLSAHPALQAALNRRLDEVERDFLAKN